MRFRSIMISFRPFGYKGLWLAGLCLLGLLPAGAQVKKVKGLVTDSSTGKPLAGATVQLKTTKGNTPVVTNDSGYFLLEAPDASDGWLSYSYMGFESGQIRWSRMEEQGVLRISMMPRLQDGDQVTVVGRRPALQSQGDSLQLNVAGLPGGEQSSAGDLLQQLPLAGKDASGNLEVKGQSPRVLIDDKPVEMNARQLTEFLESLPGSMIEKIELIQNPGNEYASEGRPVINIVTNKNKAGFSGRLQAFAGTIGEWGGNATLSYKSNAWTMMLTASARQRSQDGFGNSNRTNIYADSSNQLLTNDTFQTAGQPLQFRWQADFVPNKRRTMSLVLSVNKQQQQQEDLIRYDQINRFEELWQWSRRNADTRLERWMVQPEWALQWKGKKAGHNTRLTAQYQWMDEGQEQLFQQEYFDPKSSDNLQRTVGQQQATRQEQHIITLRGNHNHPASGGKWGWSTGGWLQWMLNPQWVNTQQWQGGGWIEAPLLSNDIRFSQQIYAARVSAFVNLPHQWRLDVQAQYEHTLFSAKSTKLSTSPQDYGNLLPYLRLRKSWGKQLHTNLIYRETIRRPGMQQLSPVVYIQDPFNLRTGNPRLVPTATREAEWNAQWQKGKSFAQGGFTFRSFTDMVQPIRLLADSGVTITTYQNLASSNQYSVDATWGIMLHTHWRIQASASWRYTTYPQDDQERFRFQNGWSANASAQLFWQPGTAWSAQASMQFSRVASAQGVARSNIGNRLVVQYRPPKTRWSLGVTVTDPFTPQFQEFETTGLRFSSYRYRTVNTRNYQASVGWGFQKTIRKK